MSNETILIVDADAKSQKVLEVSFKKAGYHVVITDTIRDAIQRVGTERPDLIITDTTLPDGDGFSFCEQLKRNDQFKEIPVIFLTEGDALDKKMRAFELGAAEYLTKPIYIKEVTSRVELLLQRRAKARLSAENAEEVEGSLDEITMIDLLQTIETELKSGTLNLSREGHDATVYFREGNILDAVCGNLQGEEAIYRLMLWPKGTFTLRYHDDIRRADHIEKGSSELLMEGMRRFDMWNEMVLTLPHLSRLFEADYQRLPGLINEMPPEVGRIVRLFDGVRTLRDVIDDSPVDDITTLRVIRKLLDDDVLLDITPSEDSLRQTAQQTNLAAWLSGRQIRKADTEEVSALFDTTPGFKSVPGLNADSAVETDEEIAEVAQTLEEISSSPVNSPSEREFEEGQAPNPTDAKEAGHWRFHWDQEANEAVAAPRTQRRSNEDLFALDDLEQDLAALEQRRREEEARRLAADRVDAGIDEAPEPASAEPPQDEDPEDEGPREITKELHRQSVLEEIDERHEQEQQSARPVPDDGMTAPERPAPTQDSGTTSAERRAASVEEADEVKRATQESLAQKIASDFDSGTQHAEDGEGEGRQRTDQFAPIAEDYTSPEPEPASERRVPATTPSAQDKEEVETVDLQRPDPDEVATLEEPRPGAVIPDTQEDPPPTNAPTRQPEPAAPTVDRGEPAVEDIDEELPTPEESAPKAQEDPLESPPLIPLGAEDSEEPTVSEEDLQAYQERPKQTEAPPASAEEVAADRPEEPEAPALTEAETDDYTLEEVSEEEAKQENFLDHRTARNQELVQTEYELKGEDAPEEGAAAAVEADEAAHTDSPQEADKAASEAPDAQEEAPAQKAQEDDAKDAATEEPDEEEEAQEAEEDAAAAPEEDETAEDVPEESDDEESDDEADTEEEEAEEEEAEEEEAEEEEAEEEEAEEEEAAAAPVEDEEEDEEDLYAMEAPLFADEDDSGFSTGGLVAIAAVVIAVLCVLVFAFSDLGETDPKEVATDGQEDKVAAAEPDLTETAEPTEPDMAVAAAEPDMAPPEPTGLTEEELPAAAANTASDVEYNTAVLAMLKTGVDPTTVEDPITYIEEERAKAEEEAKKKEEEAAKQKQASAGNQNTAPSGNSFDAQLDRVERLINREKLGPASSQVDQLAKKAPQNGRVAALTARASVYNNPGKAVQEFKRAQALGYSSPEMYLDWATAYAIQRNQSAEKKTYERFLARYPQHKRADEIRAILESKFN